jgi:hypothetical protein
MSPTPTKVVITRGGARGGKPVPVRARATPPGVALILWSTNASGRSVSGGGGTRGGKPVPVRVRVTPPVAGPIL